nr:elastin-like [Penaeus vannamei]
MNGVTVGGVGRVVGTVVLLVGAVWARHYCIVVRRRKMRRNASDEANPDVVPSVGTSYDHPSGPGEASRHRFWTKDAYPPGAGPSSAGDDDACAGGLSRQSIAEEDEDQDSDGDVGGGFPAAAARGARGVTGGNRHSIAAFMGGRGSDENVGGVRGMGTRNRHSFAGGVGAPGYSAGMSRHSFAGGPVRHSLSGGFGRHSMGGGGMPGGGMAAGGGLSGGVTVPRTGGAINRHSYGGRQGSAGSLGGVGAWGRPGGSGRGLPVRVAAPRVARAGGQRHVGRVGRPHGQPGVRGAAGEPGVLGQPDARVGRGLEQAQLRGRHRPGPGGTNRHSFAGGMSGQRSAGSLGSLGKVAGGSRHSYAGGFGSGAGGVVVNPLGQTFTLPARPRGEIFPGGSLPRSLKDIKMSTIAPRRCPLPR